MSRLSLLQNYGSKFVFEPMDNPADWATYQVSISSDPASGGIRLDSTVAGEPFHITKRTMHADLSDAQFIDIPIYVFDINKLSMIDFYISSVSDLSKYFFMETLASQLANGWNTIRIPLNTFGNAGLVDFGSPMTTFRISAFAVSGQQCSITVGACSKVTKAASRVMIQFDDGWDSVYFKAYPAMSAKGIKGTAFIISNKVGTAGYMTLAQLTELYNAGWDIGNHTVNHYDLTTLSLSDARNEIQGCTSWLLTNGFTRSAYQMAFPYGGYNSDIICICNQIGIKTSRWTWHWPLVQYNPMDKNKLFEMLPLFSLNNLTSSVSSFYLIENALQTGQSAVIYGHKIVDSGATDETEVDLSVLQDIVNYLVDRKANVVTTSEWYTGLTNLRGLNER